MTCRYVLGREDSSFTPTERGDVVWIWEGRFGYLETKHFNISNTAGDSGKTAVVSAEGMQQLHPVFFDAARCPYSDRSRKRRVLAEGLRTSPAHVEAVD